MRIGNFGRARGYHEGGTPEVSVGWWHLDGPPPEDPVERSLADVVQTWIRAIREGYATWTDGQYVNHEARNPDFPVYAQY